MLLDDKNAPLALRDRSAKGFGGLVGGTLVAVPLELVVGSCGNGRQVRLPLRGVKL